jgi:hypothetical protein
MRRPSYVQATQFHNCYQVVKKMRRQLNIIVGRYNEIIGAEILVSKQVIAILWLA